MSGKPAQATTRKSEILNTKDDGTEVQKDDGEETKDDDEVNVPQTVPEDDEEEDIQPIRKPIIPVKPNALEVEDHRKLHLPYRSWCEECVMGRGLGEQRDSHTEGEHRVPVSASTTGTSRPAASRNLRSSSTATATTARPNSWRTGRRVPWSSASSSAATRPRTFSPT